MNLVVPSLNLESAFLAFFEDFSTNDMDNIESYLLGRDNWL